MAALDFPASPTLNEVYSANGRSWIWNGTTWNPYGSGIADGDRGDITVSSNGSVWTVDNDTITNAKLANMAQSTIKGRAAGAGTGDPTDLTGTQATAILDNFVGDSGSGGTKGLVPAPAAGDAAASKFLKADGTWAAPSGSGDVVGPASATDNAVARFDSTTGKLIQNSVVTISDTGDIAGVDSIQFDTATPPSLTTQGQMAWNADEETVDIQLNSFTMHTGEHVLYHVANQTGSTIAKGTPVMFAGTDGSSGKLLIQPWNGTGPSVYFIGLTAEQLLDTEEGFVIAFGKLRGIQTDGGNYGETWVDGDIIYADNTTGSLTKTQPAAPNPHIIVCAVINAHPSNGTLFIRPTYGSNIKDDEGVTITSLTTGDLLIATSGGATGVFENKAMSGDATIASTGALTIANDAVTNAKLANMAQATIKGRASGAGTGDPTDLTGTQATAILDNFVGDSGSGGTKGLVPAPAAGDAAAGKYLDADGTWSVPPASGVSDGDKGDITVSGSGTVWTIDNDAVTYAKMQNVSAASRLLGRGSASGAGDVQEITLGTGLSLSGTTLSSTSGATRYAQLSGNVAITDNAVFQSITGLSFSASANTAYLIRFHLAVSTSATSTGYEVGITGPSTPTGYFAIASLWNSATAESVTITNSTTYGSIGSNANAGGGTARPAEGVILFRNGANAGTFQLQGKVETAVSGTVTFETGSFMTWEEVTT